MAVSLRGFLDSLEEYVWCYICDQPPWRTSAQRAYEIDAVRCVSWCHGERREWLIWEGDILARRPLNLVAFPAPLIALPPILVRIRRFRGRRHPVPTRAATTVWHLGPMAA